MTQLIRGLYNLKPKHQHTVCTIGNFDGVHLGHQKLISEVVKQAKAAKTKSMVITFEPHPFEFFAANNQLARITRFKEKFLEIAKLDVDYVLLLPFNHKLAGMSASNFAIDVITQQIKPSKIIIGNDFRFGHKRQGDIALLQEIGQEHGYSVIVYDAVKVGETRISSTAVRNALAQGNLMLAEKMLGHPYAMLGRIRRGEQRGRQLGFPTANIHLHRKLTPLRGVFTVLVYGLNQRPHPGVANIGVRPTVDGTQTILEVHLLNFNKDIYGQYVKVEFCTKLRDEIRFSNIDLLQKQIASDVAAAENYFQKQGMT